MTRKKIVLPDDSIQKKIENCQNTLVQVKEFLALQKK